MNNRWFWRVLLVWLVAGGALVGSAAWAQQRKAIVVGSPAGGTADGLARSLAADPSFQAALGGGPIIIENRVGAMGLPAAQFVAAQPADGSWLLVLRFARSGPSAEGSQVVLSAVRSFVPIAYLGDGFEKNGDESWYALLGPPGLPARTARVLEQAAQAAVRTSAFAESARYLNRFSLARGTSAEVVAKEVGAAPQGGPVLAGAEAQGSSSTAACTNDIMSLQVASQQWTGSAHDVAARLGRLQKEMFQGRCARHPEAAAYIAGADRMIGYGGNANAVSGAPSSSGGGSSSSASSSKRSNVPEANATNCLAPQKEGGVINSCAFAVEYSYCVVKPIPGSWSASFDCNQGKSGLWQVGPNSRAIMHTGGAAVAYFGCRYGPTLSKPDGISPADFDFNAGSPTGRCKEWGAP